MSMMASSSRLPRSRLRTPIASYSAGDSCPTPTPRTRRPLESRSIVASSRAAVTGLRIDISRTPVPNFSFSLRPVTMAMPAIGSMRHAGPTMRSENQMESQSSSSAASMYCRNVSRPSRAITEAPASPIFTDMPTSACSLQEQPHLSQRLILPAASRYGCAGAPPALNEAPRLRGGAEAPVLFPVSAPPERSFHRVHPAAPPARTHH